MSQIENKLDGDGDLDDDTMPVEEDDKLLFVDLSTGKFVDSKNAFFNNTANGSFRKATIQDYADWCGEMADKYAPNVTWTMCNGLTANNTIHTCNAIDEGAEWLESYGKNGRIQVDQPPIFTEFEEGFQTYGESPSHPSDYFWGRTTRASARQALQWFARG
jgi:hypothetical protein